VAGAPPLTDWNESRKEHSAKKRNSKDEVNYLKADEVRRLARNVASPTVRNECMIRLAVATGLRRGELVRLKLSDGTWTAAYPETFSEGPPRQIVIRPEVAKNGERRTIGWPKDARLETILKRWIEDYRPTLAKASESEYLFPSNMSEYISGQTFNDVVKEAADNADIQETYAVNKAGEERQAVTAHVLRHTFAMRCINAGWDIYALSSALGHSSVQVTEESYLHDSKEIVLEHFRDNGPKFGGN
jgi:integrase/recombinase XerD